jgi:hypothetical protein
MVLNKKPKTLMRKIGKIEIPNLEGDCGKREGSLKDKRMGWF